MLNISLYQRNANQNYNETSPVSMAIIKKIYKQYMLERVWSKGNPLALSVECKLIIATMEDSVEIP